MRNIFFLLLLGLVVYTVIDVTRSERHERRGVPAFVWILLILITPLLGSAAWLLASRSAPPAPGSPVPDRRRTTAPSGPLAPDDDPEFLWSLEQKHRQQERDAPKPDDDGAGPDRTDPRG